MGPLPHPAQSYDWGVDVAVAVVLVAASYALGGYSTALAVGRATGHDPTREGSHNPGASNVYRLSGTRAGLVAFAGDLAKGVAAAGGGELVGGPQLALACGGAAVVGHCFPLRRLRHGGRGVATSAGLSLVLVPLVMLALVPVWVLVARLSRTASLASLTLAVALPTTVAFLRPAWETLGFALVSALVVARHGGNLARLARGDERSLETGRP